MISVTQGRNKWGTSILYPKQKMFMLRSDELNVLSLLQTLVVILFCYGEVITYQ